MGQSGSQYYQKAQTMKNRLTKYSSFEEIKQDVHPATLSVAKKDKLNEEAKQMAEIFQKLRASKQKGNART